MSITDSAIRKAILEAKSVGKPLKRCYEHGMFMLATPPPDRSGWRFKYKIEGREKLLSLGIYPDVPLARAREKRDEMRKLVADGIDPSTERKAALVANANSVEQLAEEFFTKKAVKLTDGSMDKHRARFKRYVAPYLGKRPIIQVEPADLLDVLLRIENSPGRTSNRETAKRVRQLCGGIWRYAIAARPGLQHPKTGLRLYDISRDLKDALTSVTVKNLAAITDPAEVGGLLRAIDGYTGQPVTGFALRLAPLHFVRPGELRRMEWSEVDLDGAVWKIPGPKMKMRIEHIVPLSVQAVALLRELQLHTGDGKYAFPGARSAARPMSENTVNGALRRLGYGGQEHTGHGFRSTASTILNELGWNPDAIEAQLAHQDGNQIRRVYNRAKFMPERIKMMQAWADHLDALRSGKSNVVPIRSKAAG